MENFENEKHRHRILRAVLFVLYLVLLTYFLFSPKKWGAAPTRGPNIPDNLTLLKRFGAFFLYRNILGWRAVFLNIFGNVLAFMPFGFFSAGHLGADETLVYHEYLSSFAMSLLVETMQLVGKVGSFDVDDLLLNTIGGFAGYIILSLREAFGRDTVERIGNKVSYIKSRLQRIVLWRQGSQRRHYLCAAAISFSLLYTQGNAPLAAAALGFCSIIIAGVIGGLWCICHDGEREELSSGEDQPCGGGDPAAGGY